MAKKKSSAVSSSQPQAVPRVISQEAAAAMLRVTPRRLQQLEESPWWHSQMRTEDGYDVVAIALAQVSGETASLRNEQNMQILHLAVDWSTDMLDSCARHSVPISSILPDPRDAKAVFAHFKELISPTA